jgi:hypothetical protein
MWIHADADPDPQHCLTTMSLILANLGIGLGCLLQNILYAQRILIFIQIFFGHDFFGRQTSNTLRLKETPFSFR